VMYWPVRRPCFTSSTRTRTTLSSALRASNPDAGAAAAISRAKPGTIAGSIPPNWHCRSIFHPLTGGPPRRGDSDRPRAENKARRARDRQCRSGFVRGLRFGDLQLHIAEGHRGAVRHRHGLVGLDALAVDGDAERRVQVLDAEAVAECHDTRVSARDAAVGDDLGAERLAAADDEALVGAEARILELVASDRDIDRLAAGVLAGEQPAAAGAEGGRWRR